MQIFIVFIYVFPNTAITTLECVWDPALIIPAMGDNLDILIMKN